MEKQMTGTESFRDRISTVDSKGKRSWIYALRPRGIWYRRRTFVSWLFFGVFLALPFLRYQGRPVFLFNIPEAKFILFGKVFWPQDFFIFGLTMITFIVFIVLFTAAFGRLFCGWVCPQTIFMEMVFRKIEYLIEGDAPKQKALASGPWNTEKILKKSTKHVIFFLLSFVIANFFLSYIIGMDALVNIITEPVSRHVAGFMSIVVFSGIFYSVYAFFREQACTVVCPYGRLQGVLLDRNSLIVAYDHKRGEPRAKFRKNVAKDAGDCIDCHQCVRVCPTGIDIRNGTQMECVSCTACIDACNQVMDAVGRPRDLIRYASENGITKAEPLRFTTRMKLYTGLLSILVVILVTLLATRKDITATVMRTPGILPQERGTDSVANLFTIKVVNKTLEPIPLRLRVEGLPGRIEMIGAHDDVRVAAEGQGSGTFFLVLPRHVIQKRNSKIRIQMYDGNRSLGSVSTQFLTMNL